MKTCSTCKKEQSLDQFYFRKSKGKHYSVCRACVRKANKRYYKANTEKVKGISKRYYQERKDTPEFKEKQKRFQSALHKRNKRIALGKIGLRCACCGESQIDFLTIDHVNNDGHLHRKEIKGYQLYALIAKPEFKSKYELQTLCFNCNFAKRYNGGVCPHQERSETIP